MAKEYSRNVIQVANIPLDQKISLIDDMEGSLEWMDWGSTGTDFIIELSTARAYRGYKSLHIVTKATTPVPGDVVSTGRVGDTGQVSVIKMEAKVMAMNATSNINYVEVRFDAGHKGKGYSSGIRCGGTTDTIYYLDKNNQWINTGVTIPFSVTNAWMKYQLYIDTEKGEYIKVIIMGIEADLSGIKMYEWPSLGNILNIQFKTETLNNAPAEVYIDDLIALEI